MGRNRLVRFDWLHAVVAAALSVVLLSCMQAESQAASERAKFPSNGLTTSTNVEANCDGTAHRSESYLRATQVVSELPEFKKWKGFLPQSSKIWFGPIDSQVQRDRKCFWPVIVYESQIAHLVRWNSFLVEPSRKEIFIMDLEGEYVPIAQWRGSFKQK